MEKWERARKANSRVAQAAQRLRFISRMPLFCECDDPACDALVLMRREDYARFAGDQRLRVTAPGHWIEAGTTTAEAPGYWVQQS